MRPVAMSLGDTRQDDTSLIGPVDLEGAKVGQMADVLPGGVLLCCGREGVSF